jgi:hypothetical protein
LQCVGSSRSPSESAVLRRGIQTGSVRESPAARTPHATLLATGEIHN